jgi:hypothetical protein
MAHRNIATRRTTIVRAALAAALLVVQLIQFARARFVEHRYFCWAPFHSEARYAIDAVVRGKALDDDAIAARYRLSRLYWDPRSRTNWELNAIAHVHDTVRATEDALPESERAAVVIRYRVNGHGEQQWHYP